MEGGAAGAEAGEVSGAFLLLFRVEMEGEAVEVEAGGTEGSDMVCEFVGGEGWEREEDELEMARRGV